MALSVWLRRHIFQFHETVIKPVSSIPRLAVEDCFFSSVPRLAALLIIWLLLPSFDTHLHLAHRCQRLRESLV